MHALGTYIATLRSIQEKLNAFIGQYFLKYERLVFITLTKGARDIVLSISTKKKKTLPTKTARSVKNYEACLGMFSQNRSHTHIYIHIQTYI